MVFTIVTIVFVSYPVPVFSNRNVLIDVAGAPAVYGRFLFASSCGVPSEYAFDIRNQMDP
jgi:hypothetical protein